MARIQFNRRKVLLTAAASLVAAFGAGTRVLAAARVEGAAYVLSYSGKDLQIGRSGFWSIAELGAQKIETQIWERGSKQNGRSGILGNMARRDETRLDFIRAALRSYDLAVVDGVNRGDRITP